MCVALEQLWHACAWLWRAQHGLGRCSRGAAPPSACASARRSAGQAAPHRLRVKLRASLTMEAPCMPPRTPHLAARTCPIDPALLAPMCLLHAGGQWGAKCQGEQPRSALRVPALTASSAQTECKAWGCFIGLSRQGSGMQLPLAEPPHLAARRGRAVRGTAPLRRCPPTQQAAGLRPGWRGCRRSLHWTSWMSTCACSRAGQPAIGKRRSNERWVAVVRRPPLGPPPVPHGPLRGVGSCQNTSANLDSCMPAARAPHEARHRHCRNIAVCGCACTAQMNAVRTIELVHTAQRRSDRGVASPLPRWRPMQPCL